MKIKTSVVKTWRSGKDVMSKTLVLGPEDAIVYVPELWWADSLDKLDNNQRYHIFLALIKNDSWVDSDNIVFVDEELNKMRIIQQRYNINKEDYIKEEIFKKINRFELLDIKKDEG